MLEKIYISNKCFSFYKKKIFITASWKNAAQFSQKYSALLDMYIIYISEESC